MSKLKTIKGKTICLMLIAAFIAYNCVPVFALETTNFNQNTKGNIQVYVKPDVTILVNGEKTAFRDVNGEIVYPVIYKGSTYLPIRAISGLMEENIEWNEYTKTIFIGKTLRNPNKINRGFLGQSYFEIDNLEIAKPRASMVSAYLRPEFLIMYDFNLQTFFDEKEEQIYPIVINGSTYLPVRATAQIMNQTIKWDAISKTIRIEKEEIPQVEKSLSAKLLIKQFEDQLVLYDNATVKIQNIQKAQSIEELMIIATEVSKDYVTAKEYTERVLTIDFSDFSQNEKEAYYYLSEFAVLSEQYILVLENIAYLAAAEQDSSMLVETFVNLVIKSQKSLDEARTLIEML